MSRNRFKKSVLCTLYFVPLLAVVFFALSAYCFAQGVFVYDSKGKRDPFIPLVTPDGRLLKLDQQEEKVSPLILEGIIFDKSGMSYAVVNGEVVRVGDKVEGHQVLKIEERKITFIREGQIVALELEKEEEP